MDRENVHENARDVTRVSFAKLNTAKKKFKKLIFIPAVFAAVIIFIVICFVFFFKVKTVSVEGASKYSEDLLIIKSGIIAGENLYSYSEKDIEEKLMLNYPYISNVKLKRRWPDKITIQVSEDTAAYVTEIYGETLILSESLRILENPDINADSVELCKLILPDIDRALVGNAPVFTIDSGYILTALKAIRESELADRKTKIDLRNKFSISFLMGNMYKVKCGDINDLDLKLTMTEKILESGQISDGTKAELDISNPAECTALLGDNANISL